MITAAELKSIASQNDKTITIYVEHILDIAKTDAQMGKLMSVFSYNDMSKEVFSLIDKKLRSLGFNTGYSMLNDKIYQVRVSWY